MAGDTINQILVGDDVYYPVDCLTGPAYIKCGGTRNLNCIRFIGPNFTQATLYCVTGCDPVPCQEDYLEQWNGSTWDLLSTGTNPCTAYGFIYWDPWTFTGYNTASLCRHRMNSTTKEFYINWFYLTIHTHDYAGNPIVGMSVPWTCTDGQSGTGTSNASGEVTLFVPKSSSVTYSTTPFTSGCDSFTGEVCSKTVSNITADTSSTMTHYAVNNCINNGGTIVSEGANWQPCNAGLWNIGGGGPILKVVSIDSGSTFALCDIHLPWDATGVFSITSEVIYANSWSSTWTSGSTSFNFYIGGMKGLSEPKWIKPYQWCYNNRAGMGGAGTINKSAVYVDCTSGNDANSGLCSFTYALKTIGAAQTIVDNNGIIYVKYGDCTNEILDSVLNPIVANVTISPRTNDTTEGTGTLYIDGT